MSTLTTRLGLLKPAGTDPFQRTDFNTTWDTLDAAPGSFVCTSGSRPAWGVDQAGRLIFETDTSRLMQWTGTVWAHVRQAANGWDQYTNWGEDNLPDSSSPNNKSLGDITTTTPGSLQWYLIASIICIQGDVQNVTMGFQIGGVDAFSGVGGFKRWAIPSANITGSPDEDVSDVHLTGMTTIAAGTHNLRATFAVGNGGQNLKLRNTRWLGWMVQGTGTH